MFDRATYAREWARRRRANNPAAREVDRAATAKFRANNKDRIKQARKGYRAKAKLEKPLEQFHLWLWRAYRMTPEQYAEMLESQGGVCAHCSGNNNGRRLFVDHDHSKPKGEGNRWLLCSACNKMIGFARENSSILRSAARKLDEYYGNPSSSIGLHSGSESAATGCSAALSLPG